ncbi:hypothetical protein ACEWY4_007974 [Coilia grayii]|uniref:Ig-like domain-containing protein n=1 Tax=Coilia grayii TaxID=363190 RepID=A0ABD1K9S2_9TELE
MLSLLMTMDYGLEGAVDNGGPTREFFRLCLHEIKDKIGIFEGPPNAKVLTCNSKDALQRYPLQMKCLFVKAEKDLTAADVENLFQIIHSERGSNAFQEECRTLAFWQDYLQDAEFPANIYKVSEDITINEGSNVTLTCLASGRPDPMITWRLLNPSAEPLYGEEYLDISGITRTQAGRYECKASNDVASPDVKYVNVIVNCCPTKQPGPENTGERQSSRNDVPSEGGGGVAGEASAPTAQAEAETVETPGSVVSADSVAEQLNDAVLEMSEANSQGVLDPAPVLPEDESLNFDDAPFIKDTKSSDPQVGRMGVLQCEASAIPKPEFKWYRDDKRSRCEAVMGARYVALCSYSAPVSRAACLYELWLSPIFTSTCWRLAPGLSAGDWHQVFLLETGTRSFCWRLAPGLSAGDWHQVFLLETGTRSFCRRLAPGLSAGDWHQVFLLETGTRLSNGQGISIQMMGSCTLLLVSNVTEEDYGNYTCVATNRLGIHNASVFLYINNNNSNNNNVLLATP